MKYLCLILWIIHCASLEYTARSKRGFNGQREKKENLLSKSQSKAFNPFNALNLQQFSTSNKQNQLQAFQPLESKTFPFHNLNPSGDEPQPNTLEGLVKKKLPKKETEEHIEGRGLLTTQKEYSNLKVKRCEAGCIDKKPMCQVVKRKKQCHKLSAKQLRKCECSCLNCKKVNSRNDVKKQRKEKGKLEFNYEECGRRVKKKIRQMIGGKRAKAGAWPWIVGLIEVHDGLTEKERLLKPTFCGGTLINPRTVLTAAHCFDRSKFLLEEKVNVRVADLRVDHKDDNEEVVRIKRIIKHESWNNRTYENDIAMIILEKDLATKLSFSINTACLPVSSTIPSEKCSVAGWGVEKERSKVQAKQLMQIRIPVVPNHICNRYLGGKVKKGMMCAGNMKGMKDACQGDSGGPLVCKKDDKFQLRGIVSWGEGCGRKKKFGVYTDVWNYMEWIKDKMVNFD